MKTIKIQSLANSLAVIEAEKGKLKLLEKRIKELQAEFVAKADGADCRFVSESEQELASVKWQTRSSLNAELLLKAGVSPDVIKLATVESAPFAVFRIH